MSEKTTQRSRLVLKETPPGDGLYLAKTPQVLILEERHDALLAAARVLKDAFYPVAIVFEESRVVAAITAAPEDSFLLLTVRDTTRPLAVPQIIASLRQEGYAHPVTFCVKGRLSAETRAAYEALSVARVLSVPLTSRSSVVDAMVWVRDRVNFTQGGVTILEI